MRQSLATITKKALEVRACAHALLGTPWLIGQAAQRLSRKP